MNVYKYEIVHTCNFKLQICTSHFGSLCYKGNPPTLKKPYMILNLGTTWV